MSDAPERRECDRRAQAGDAAADDEEISLRVHDADTVPIVILAIRAAGLCGHLHRA